MQNIHWLLTKESIYYIPKRTLYFDQNEYQKEVGNLSHIHLILEINGKLITQAQSALVKYFIRASILKTVRPDEVQLLIDEGVFSSMYDYNGMIYYGRKVLGHECNLRLLVGVGPDKYHCWNPNNRVLTTDITKNIFKKLPND